MSSDRPRSTAAALLMAFVLAVGGCGYGPVSAAAYGHAKALYTAANMKSDAAIAQSRAAIERDADAGALADQEAAWLLAICADAESGDWKSATAASRRLMEDQVTR